MLHVAAVAVVAASHARAAFVRATEIAASVLAATLNLLIVADRRSSYFERSFGCWFRASPT
jgi:hypothetical protein